MVVHLLVGEEEQRNLAEAAEELLQAAAEEERSRPREVEGGLSCFQQAQEVVEK